MASISGANIGLYTDPSHNLYVADADPSRADVETGSTLKNGEVTIAVKSTGICGSDVHFWKHGAIGPWAVSGPHILGHESAGVVVATHPSVSTLSIGDRVAIEPHIVCGECELCMSGNYNHCEKMIFRSSPPSGGFLRRYVNHPARMCFTIPDSMTFEDGAMLEPLSVALAAVKRAEIGIADPVLICGAGPIGLVTLECVRAAGACPIVITDIDAAKLEFARSLVPGVKTHLVDPKQNDGEVFAKAIRKLSDWVEPAYALECTGIESSINNAIYSVKHRGKVFVTGVGKPTMHLAFMRLNAREIDLQFQQRYTNTWPAAIRAVSSGTVNLRSLVTHRFSLENAVEAFHAMSDPKSGVIKAQIQSE